MTAGKIKQAGFTLVELAIVLMIIGLLIGGILRGQELLSNARISSTIKQVTGYSGALNTFQDAYSAMPGDMPAARSRIPNCDAASGCVNGNGDGLVGVPTTYWELGDQTVGSEQVQFWKHLALTHIMSGVNPSVSTSQALGFGSSHPAAPIGGGFSMITSRQPGQAGANATALYSTGSLLLRLHGDLNGGPGAVIEDNPVASPRQSAQIDRKMDDGLPNSGDVQAGASGTGVVVNGGTQQDCEGTASNPNYNESVEFKLCTLAFALRR